jgi:hypothetical protein
MRISRAILLGSIAAVAVLTVPALAKTSNTQRPRGPRWRRPAATLPSRMPMVHGRSGHAKNWANRRRRHRINPPPATWSRRRTDGERA